MIMASSPALDTLLTLADPDLMSLQMPPWRHRADLPESARCRLRRTQRQKTTIPDSWRRDLRRWIRR